MEYEKSGEVKLNEEDVKFIQKIINEGKENSKIEIIVPEQGKYKLRATSYVGVVQLPSGIRVQITPKIDYVKLFMILNYIYAPETMKTYESSTALLEGKEFVDILAYLFLWELKTILRRGLYKKYVSKRENLKYLKGKLLVEKQMLLGACNRHRFFCNYEDLTYDNFMNRVVLYSSYLLRYLTESNYSLHRGLTNRFMDLKKEVTLLGSKLMKSELENITFNRLNEYYQRIIKLSKLIINNVYFENLDIGRVPAYSFLIDMNALFEDFVRKLIGEIFEDKIVRKPKAIDNLVYPRDIKIQPDIIIKEKRRVVLVLDAKYKEQKKSPDFYQVIAYGLAYDADSVVIYPSLRVQEISSYVVANTVRKVFVVSLEIEKYEDSFNYIENIKDGLKTKLSKVIEPHYG